MQTAHQPQAASAPPSPPLSQDLFERAANLKRAGEPFVLATVTWSLQPTSAKPGAKGIVTRDGALFGWVGGSCAQPSVVREALQALSDGQPRILRLSPDGEPDPRAGVVVAPMTCHSGGAIEVFLEPYLPPLQLIVFGESPVADALIRLGHVMGYRTVAVRPGAAGQAPAEAALALDSLDIASIVSGWRSVAVVASMGMYDEDAIEQALRAGVGFVGLVASHRRFESVLDTLRLTRLDANLLERVKAPAGIDIAASLPEEIAVSILAEIIARKGSLPSVDSDSQPAQEPAEPMTAIDPICGMTVEIATARHTFDYDGQRYYFCCPACRREFERSPETYIAVN